MITASQKDKNAATCGPSVPQQTNTSGKYSNMYCPVNPSEEPKGTLPDMQTTAAVLSFLKAHGEHLADETAVTPPVFLGV